MPEEKPKRKEFLSPEEVLAKFITKVAPMEDIRKFIDKIRNKQKKDKDIK